MKLPFSVEQFLEVFKNYNQAVYPMQVVLYLMAAIIVFFSIKKTANADRIISGILSFLWLWMGIVYHLIFFSPINQAAYFFGAAFILQAILFFYYGVANKTLVFSFRRDKTGWLGSLLVTFALFVYPVLGYMSGHFYPASPTFGLPCPTTIFTFAVMLWFDKKIPISILIIPFTWSIIGFFAALKLGIHEDISLPVSGILATSLVIVKNRKLTTSLTNIK